MLHGKANMQLSSTSTDDARWREPASRSVGVDNIKDSKSFVLVEVQIPGPINRCDQIKTKMRYIVSSFFACHVSASTEKKDR
jgi:hypothetical protein